MRSRYLAALLCMAAVFAGTAASAVTWPQIGPACTPDRAQPWLPDRSESEQHPCHCPPPDRCPQTYEQYSNSNLSPLPMNFVLRCCPRIDRPVCPDDSQMAGQPVPTDGDCNPYCPADSLNANAHKNDIGGLGNCNICPVGTERAGQGPNALGSCTNLCTSGSRINQPPLNGDCNPQYCPTGTDNGGALITNGLQCDELCESGPNAGQPKRNFPARDCNPPPPSCPAKYYPTLNEAGVDGNAGSYTYQNGTNIPFDIRFDDGNSSPDQDYSQMSRRYNFSIVRGSVCDWVWGPSWGPMDNAVAVGYSPLTGNYNNGCNTLPAMLYGPRGAGLIWFGLSFILQDYAPNNFVTPGIQAEWGNRDVLQVGDYGQRAIPVCTRRGSVTVCDYQNNVTLGAPPVLQAEAGDFLNACRNVRGEYVEIEWKNIGGRQCGYLQCRYIYESTAESCLTGDTGITLADGTVKKVSELKLGDVVKGSDGDHKITASNIYQSALRVMYGVNGSGQMLTGDHPIRTTEGWKVITDEAAKLYADKPGFATATKLAVGDTLITAKGEVKVTEIKRFANVEPISTHNIRVEGNNGFYANGIEVRGFDKMEMHY